MYLRVGNRVRSLCLSRSYFLKVEKVRSFSIIIEFTGLQRSIFPLNFNFPFVSEINNLIICLLRKIKPANCDMAFRFID